MDEGLMRKIIDLLVKDEKASVFSSDSGNLGIKFY